MFEYLRYAYNGAKFNGYIKRFDASRKAGNFQQAERLGAKAIEVGEKLLDLEGKLKFSVKVGAAIPVSKIREAYSFLKEVEAARQRFISMIDELEASREIP